MSIWEKVRQEFVRAFAVAPPQPILTPQESALLEKIARLVVHRRLESPAVLFLESLGPFNFLGSQVVHGLRPFLDVVCETPEVEQLAVILERRDSIDHLVRLIQQQAASSV